MNNIEILEQLEKMQQTFTEDGLQGYEMAIVTAKNLINRLIQENKELKEKNKKWEELYDEDQEYITQLNNKIFQLETDNKRLDKENQGLFEAYNFNDTNLFVKTLKEYRKEILNSVPKSKVKEKIETLEKLQNEFKNNEELRIKIIAYKELLEGE